MTSESSSRWREREAQRGSRPVSEPTFSPDDCTILVLYGLEREGGEPGPSDPSFVVGSLPEGAKLSFFRAPNMLEVSPARCRQMLLEPQPKIGPEERGALEEAAQWVARTHRPMFVIQVEPAALAGHGTARRVGLEWEDAGRPARPGPSEPEVVARVPGDDIDHLLGCFSRLAKVVSAMPGPISAMLQPLRGTALREPRVDLRLRGPRSGGAVRAWAGVSFNWPGGELDAVRLANAVAARSAKSAIGFDRARALLDERSRGAGRIYLDAFVDPSQLGAPPGIELWSHGASSLEQERMLLAKHGVSADAASHVTTLAGFAMAPRAQSSCRAGVRIDGGGLDFSLGIEPEPGPAPVEAVLEGAPFDARQRSEIASFTERFERRGAVVLLPVDSSGRVSFEYRDPPPGPALAVVGRLLPESCVSVVERAVQALEPAPLRVARYGTAPGEPFEVQLQWPA